MTTSTIKIENLSSHDADAASGIAKLYKIAGWLEPPQSKTDSDYQLERIKRALKNSFCAFGAFDGDKMVGFFRAISDGVADAYMLDMIVDPQYRKLGIASKLCDSVVEYLKSKNIEWITAIATPEGFGVYTKTGEQMRNHTAFRF